MDFLDFIAVINADLLDFISAIVNSLAWPALAGAVIYYLRNPVAELLGRLSRVKYGDIEAEFTARLEGLRTPEIEAVDALDAVPPVTLRLDQLAEISPRAAVLQAWTRVDRALNQYLEAAGRQPPLSYQGLRRLPDPIRTPISHLLTPYQELRLLRSRAVSAADSDISRESAEEFVRISTFLVREFEAASSAAAGRD